MKWEKPKCNLCGSSNRRIFLEKIKIWEYPECFDLYQCSECDLVYLFPRPTKEHISKFYDSGSYWGDDLTKEKEAMPDGVGGVEESYGQIYKYIIKSFPGGGNIFDIGAGTGIFLTKFKEIGWSIGGNELSRDAVKYAKNINGIKLLQGDLVDLNINNGGCDVITLNSSLEHLYDPKASLKKAGEMLKPPRT